MASLADYTTAAIKWRDPDENFRQREEAEQQRAEDLLTLTPEEEQSDIEERLERDVEAAMIEASAPVQAEGDGGFQTFEAMLDFLFEGEAR